MSGTDLNDFDDNENYGDENYGDEVGDYGDYDEGYADEGFGLKSEIAGVPVVALLGMVVALGATLYFSDQIKDTIGMGGGGLGF